MNKFVINGRAIGPDYPPFVIPEIGINHEGSMEKAIRMVDDAKAAGAECVKFQCHVIEDEMVPLAKKVIPGNAKESIWEIMDRCKLGEEDEWQLKKYVEGKGLIYLSTPFSRAAADRLEAMGVPAYKIGSGECNNFPLIGHIAGFGKPVILSTGMNDMTSIGKSVAILKERKVPFLLMHCTSMYPTPYEAVRLGAIEELRRTFETDLIGLSDHTTGNWACLAAAALGAVALERHFTSDMAWPGPDVPISMDPAALRELVDGSAAIWKMRGGTKGILEGEAPTIAFAYASIVTIKPIKRGEKFSKNNLWVKRPGTGELLADEFDAILGRQASTDLAADCQLRRADIA